MQVLPTSSGTSRAGLRDFKMTLNLEVSAISLGDYILEYTQRDIASRGTYTISQPFKIVE